MDAFDAAAVENDPKFPSGPWTGFYLQCWLPGRHMMMIDLTFGGGQLQAKGSDRVGPFTFHGDYDLADGKCRWVKQYVGRHRVTYTGINQGQGIWGVWEIRQLAGLYKDRGVFHIWRQGDTPTEEAEATVKAYLSHLRSRWLFRLDGPLLRWGLVFVSVFLIRQLYYVMTGISGP